MIGVPPQLSAFVCAYHPAATGLSPKHSIDTFIIYSLSFVLNLPCDKNENKQKEAGFGPF